MFALSSILLYLALGVGPNGASAKPSVSKALKKLTQLENRLSTVLENLQFEIQNDLQFEDVTDIDSESEWESNSNIQLDSVNAVLSSDLPDDALQRGFLPEDVSTAAIDTQVLGDEVVSNAIRVAFHSFPSRADEIVIRYSPSDWVLPRTRFGMPIFDPTAYDVLPDSLAPRTYAHQVVVQIGMLSNHSDSWLAQINGLKAGNYNVALLGRNKLGDSPHPAAFNNITVVDAWGFGLPDPVPQDKFINVVSADFPGSYSMVVDLGDVPYSANDVVVYYAEVADGYYSPTAAPLTVSKHSKVCPLDIYQTVYCTISNVRAGNYTVAVKSRNQMGESVTSTHFPVVTVREAPAP